MPESEAIAGAERPTSGRGPSTAALGRRNGWLSTAGCPVGGGRVVKLKLDRKRESVTARCPHCRDDHEFGMPRPRRPGESCDLDLPPDPEPTPAAVQARWTPPSDPDVLAALSDDWTLVTEIAEALGYSNRGSLVNRLAKMRQRAPIETMQEHRTAPLYVRRVDPDAVKSTV